MPSRPDPLAAGLDRWAPVRVLRYGRLDGFLLLGLLGAVILVAAQLSLPWAVGRIIDDALGTGGPGALLRWSLFLAGAALVFIAAKGCSDVAFTRWRENALLALHVHMLGHLHRLPVDYLDREESGGVHARFVNDALRAVRLFSPVVRQVVQSGVLLVMAVVVLVAQYGHLALWALALVPAYVVFPLIFGPRLRRTSAELQAAEGRLSARLQEAIGGLREIKTFNRSDWSTERIVPALRHAVNRRMRVVLCHWGYNLQFALYWGILAVAYWLGGRQVLRGELTVGELVAFVAYLGALSAPLDGLISAHGEVQASHGAVRRVLDFLGQPQEPRGAPLPHRSPRAPRVAFEGVRYTYPGRVQPALIDFDLSVEPGMRVAVVGPSGAGKSTLLKLLLRFHDPDAGMIRLDGEDLRNLAPAAVRSMIGCVPQEPTLFTGSVRENLRFGRVAATDREVETAARLAHAHDFIRELPAGYDTELGERGVLLSVGQRQRLALARVLLRAPRLVLLDEPTSALDAVSERAIGEGLERLLEGRTSFVVAHRLSTVLAADRLVVVDAGRMVAAGTHAELLASSPLYGRLCRMSLTESNGASPRARLRPEPLRGATATSAQPT
jgi:ATP-binding cassette, subfamily B, bacterial